jgi:Na+/H+ antiporter NhaC
MGGTIKTFLEILPYAFIPLMSIVIIVVAIIISIDNWLKKDDNWQNFLNKKL